MENLLRSLFDNLNSSVNYAVLRNFQSLPVRFENDLDLLVDPSDVSKAIDILAISCVQNSFRIVKRVRRLNYWGFYIVEKAGSEIYLIDIFTGFSKAWRTYADYKKILDNRIERDGFYTLSLEDEFSTILSKELLTYSLVRDKYKKRFKEIFDNDDFDLSKCRFDSFRRKSKFLLSSISTFEQVFTPTRVYLRKSSFLTFIKYSFFRIREIVLRLIKRPAIIVFIGPDGIGKSTMSEELRRLLQKNNFFNGVKVYHHRFDFIPQLGNFLNWRKISNESNSQTEALTKRGVIHSRLRTFIYMAYYGIDYALGHLDIFIRQIHGGATIFDRYLFDFHIQKSYSRMPRVLKNVYAKFFPKPSLIVFLYANPFIVINRKKELSLSDHVAQNEACMGVLRDNRENALFCNCNEPLEKSVDRMKRLILERF